MSKQEKPSEPGCGLSMCRLEKTPSQADCDKCLSETNAKHFQGKETIEHNFRRVHYRPCKHKGDGIMMKFQRYANEMKLRHPSFRRMDTNRQFDAFCRDNAAWAKPTPDRTALWLSTAATSLRLFASDLLRAIRHPLETLAPREKTRRTRNGLGR